MANVKNNKTNIDVESLMNTQVQFSKEKVQDIDKTKQK